MHRVGKDWPIKSANGSVAVERLAGQGRATTLALTRGAFSWKGGNKIRLVGEEEALKRWEDRLKEKAR